jgi:CBS domain-containing protein
MVRAQGLRCHAGPSQRGGVSAGFAPTMHGTTAALPGAMTEPKTVRDIMNPTLLYVRDGDRMTLVRSRILQFGVTGVPVLDDLHRPVGFVSLRDIPTDRDDRIRVTAPVLSARDTEPLAKAARRLAESTFHRMVVVDGSGIAVGMVSAVDFLRALTGAPLRHPDRFER